jgi:hypothetical protein
MYYEVNALTYASDSDTYAVRVSLEDDGTYLVYAEDHEPQDIHALDVTAYHGDLESALEAAAEFASFFAECWQEFDSVIMQSVLIVDARLAQGEDGMSCAIDVLRMAANGSAYAKRLLTCYKYALLCSNATRRAKIVGIIVKHGKHERNL